MVEGVEELGPELRMKTIADRDVLESPDVPVKQARPDNRALRSN